MRTTEPRIMTALFGRCIILIKDTVAVKKDAFMKINMAIVQTPDWRFGLLHLKFTAKTQSGLDAL